MKQSNSLLLGFLAISNLLSCTVAFNEKNLGANSISVDLYLYICELLPTGSTILELGSGSGTEELAHYYHMHSIEHDEKWMNKYPSNYIFSPIRDYGAYKWYDVDYLKGNLPTHYDLILVDGPPGWFGRAGFLHHIDLFNTNVPIIFDDTQRKAEIELCEKAAEALNRTYTMITCSDKKKFGVILPN